VAETHRSRAEPKIFPRRGEIYLAVLDPALGHEIRKTRPALVIQNDITNRYGLTTVVAAITSRVNTPPYPNEVVVAPAGTGLDVISTVRLDQIRTVDRQRLIKRLGKVDDATMDRVDDAIQISLGLIHL
jgi:mRNA interferase MazF